MSSELETKDLLQTIGQRQPPEAWKEYLKAVKVIDLNAWSAAGSMNGPSPTRAQLPASQHLRSSHGRIASSGGQLDTAEGHGKSADPALWDAQTERSALTCSKAAQARKGHHGAETTPASRAQNQYIKASPKRTLRAGGGGIAFAETQPRQNDGRKDNEATQELSTEELSRPVRSTPIRRKPCFAGCTRCDRRTVHSEGAALAST